nr:hypothetical protein JVH1_5720 [Rhodococcus sp. JVH1]
MATPGGVRIPRSSGSMIIEPPIVRASRRAPLTQRHDRYDVTLAVSIPSPYRSVESGVRKCSAANQDKHRVEPCGTECTIDSFH